MPIVFLLRAIIDKAVNRLVRDHAVSIFNLQVARDLLGRPALFKPLVHIMAQRTIARELEERIAEFEPATHSVREGGVAHG